jgi:ribosome biogenesis GTPase
LKHYDYEEEFHARDRKQFRKERKLAQQADRSKYKKTDLETAKKIERAEGMLRGRVLSITGEGSLVDCEGKQILCTLKGFLKKEKTLSKNLIAVGDWVHFSLSSEKEGAIAEVEERTSFLGRTDISGKKEQLIAVNIDVAVISVSVVDPPLKPSLVDRYLIAAEKGNIQPVIAINKIDLLDSAPEEEKLLYRDFLAAYEPLGIPILSLSTETGVGIEALRSLLQNKTSVFSGQSGVGKSSLLNACFGFSLRVGELAQKTFKGAHTTTTAELIPLPGGGYCVDTPGIRSFAIWKLQKEEVASHFQDIAAFADSCKYPDCSHISEPECAALAALEEGKISPLRYDSYRTLYTEALAGPDKTTWS